MDVRRILKLVAGSCQNLKPTDSILKSAGLRHLHKNTFLAIKQIGCQHMSRRTAVTSTQDNTKLAQSNQQTSRDLYGPVFTDVIQFRKRPAIVTPDNDEYLYEDLYMRSWDLAKGLLGISPTQQPSESGAVRQARVCVLSESVLCHVVMSWACWLAGNTVVTVENTNNVQHIQDRLRESGCSMVLATKSLGDKAQAAVRGMGSGDGVAPRLVVLDESWWNNSEPSGDQDTNSQLPGSLVDPSLYKDGEALVLFTAGRSAGRPRGVVLSHTDLTNQINRVVDAWSYTADDSVLNTLQTHQTYGMINCLLAPLSVGARVTTLPPKFDANLVWSYLLGVGVTSGKKYRNVNIFPATPTIYRQLLSASKDIFKDKKSREYVKKSCSKRLRLMTCSTVSLDSQTRQDWATLTGVNILENYILTEVGTAFSSVYKTNAKKENSEPPVSPWNGMDYRLVLFRDHMKQTLDVLVEGNEHKCKVLVDSEDDLPVIGELLLRGEGFSKHYLEGSVEKAKLDPSSWLVTGDIWQYYNGQFAIKGRLNIRCIKRGNELVGSAELEKKILSNPDVTDAYLLGIGDTDGEQEIGVVMVLNKNRKVTMDNILTWCNDNLPYSHIPTVFKMTDQIPRNNKGYVDKLHLMSLFPEASVLCFHSSKL